MMKTRRQKKKKREPCLLIVSSYDARYVLRDIKAIQKYFPTKVIIGHDTHNNIIKIFKLVVRILRGVLWADISFIWFADFRALIAIAFSKFLNKKTILVVGGYEVANEPDILYGGVSDKRLKRKISWIIRHADVVLSVSEASRNELIKNYGYTKSILVYNGVETDTFDRNSHIPKENVAITVGVVTLSNLNRKGIETFVRAAAYLPEIPFYVIGKAEEAAYERLKKIAPENVVFTGFVSEQELVRYYQKAKVYVQVSCHEAFGVSLAEAMLCECVPVTSKKGALPEVVADTGYYVPFNKPEETAEAIRKAMASSNGRSARKHILDNFSMKRREDKLVDIIRGTIWK